MVADLQLSAGSGQLEALGPAVDGLRRERLAVEGRGPAGVGGVGEAQHAPAGARRDGGADVDRSGGDGDVGAAGGADQDPAGVVLEPPEAVGLLLVQAGETGGGVERRGEAVVDRCEDLDVLDAEVRQLGRLVAAGTGGEVADQLRELRRGRVRGRALAAADGRPGAAHQGVGDDLAPVAGAQHQRADLVAALRLLGDERGDERAVAALDRTGRATDQPPARGRDRREGGGEQDEGRDGLTPAEVDGGDALAGVVGADRGGGEQRDAGDEGGRTAPDRHGRLAGAGHDGGARDDHGADEADGGRAPGRDDGAAAVGAQQRGERGHRDADDQQTGDDALAAGVEGEQVHRGGRRADQAGDARLQQEAARVRQQPERPRREDQQRRAEHGRHPRGQTAQRADALAERAAAQERAEQRDAGQQQAEQPGERHEGRGKRERERGDPGAAPAGAAATGGGLAADAEAEGDRGGAGQQRQQDGEDGGADAALRDGAGRRGQQRVAGAGPGANQAGVDQRPGDQVGGDAGQRHGQQQQQRDREPRISEAEAGERGQHAEVGRGAARGADADGLPAAGVLLPQVGGAARGRQQRAAVDRAAGEQRAAGDQGQHEQTGEEHGRGLAGDPLDHRELLDLEDVVVVVDGAGLDGAVPGREGLVRASAAEFGDEVLGGGPGGGAERREERAVVERVPRPGAPAPGAAREQRAEAQHDVAEAADLVEREVGGLGEEVAEGTQHGADVDPQQQVRQQRGAGVGQQRVDAAGLVDPVRTVGPGAVDGAALAAGGLRVADDGVGRDDGAVARGGDAPAQVHVVTHQRQLLVEAAELLEDVTADQHARAGDGEDRADLVALALVLLAAVQAGPTAAGAGDADADLEQLAPVVPGADLGTDDGGGRRGLGDLEQLAQRVRRGLAVVVEQPEPLDGLGVARPAQLLGGELVVVAERVAELIMAAVLGVERVVAVRDGVRQALGVERRQAAHALVDRGAEAGAPSVLQHGVLAERVGEQARSRVGGSGVGGDDALHGPVLSEQTAQGLRQPAGPVVGHDDGGDQVPGISRRAPCARVPWGLMGVGRHRL